VTLASICLAVIVHRQWAHHERLRYPIAEFATSLMEAGPGGRPAPIFHDGLFWAGLMIALSLRAINGLNAWFPDVMIQIPMQFTFGQVPQKWPMLTKIPQGEDLFAPRFFPIAIAFTFFLSTDISLSLGISQVIFVFAGMVLVARGVDLTTDNTLGGGVGWQRFGSYVAFTVMMFYVGRRYYGQIARSALFLGKSRETTSDARWAFRLFLLASAGLAILFVRLGLAWPLSILAVAFLLLFFLGVARIVAETGLIFILPGWTVLGALLGLVGGYAMGIQGVLVAGMISILLMLDVSAVILPNLVNGLKVCDQLGVKVGRAALASGTTYALCALLAIPVALWANYNWGLARSTDTWMNETVPKVIFNAGEKESTKLALADEARASADLSSLQRLTEMRPDKGFLWFAGTGFVLVILVGLMRLRFSWWPLHPVMFLIWATHPMKRLWASLMVGWAIKVLITRLGGYHLYRRCRGLMIGVIAGELLAGIVFMIIQGVYYLVTHRPPVAYGVSFG
jgi:hypothetical protein